MRPATSSGRSIDISTVASVFAQKTEDANRAACEELAPDCGLNELAPDCFVVFLRLDSCGKSSGGMGASSQASAMSESVGRVLMSS